MWLFPFFTYLATLHTLHIRFLHYYHNSRATSSFVAHQQVSIMNNIVKNISAALVCTTLAACGGGESNEEKSIDSTEYVDGSFKSLADTGFTVSKYDSPMFGCFDNGVDRYFESENIIAVSTTDLPDSDLQHAATLASKSFPVALQKMGLTKAQYLDKKTSFISRDIQNLAYLVTDSRFADDFESAKTNLPELYQFLSSYLSDSEIVESYTANNAQRYMQGVFGGMTNVELTQAFELAEQLDLLATVEIQGSNEKVVVCVDSQRQTIGWGEGGATGVGIAANSTSPRSDDYQITLHEMIHHLQITIAGFSSGSSELERWFAEGQAVYLSGMNITTGNHSRNPIAVTTFVEESVYSDVALAYEDYGQAYKYVSDTYGESAISDLLIGIRTGKIVQDNNFEDASSQYYPFFSAEFTKHITNLEELRENYPNIEK